MFVLEQCYSHNHQWYKPLLPQGVPFLWRLTNQTVSEDLLSAATAQIESAIKNSLTTLSSRNLSVCADLKFIFLSCSTSRIYWLNNSQEPYSTWHLSRTQNQGDAFLIWENRWKTITWNVLEPKTVLNIFNFALVLRRQSSVLSISFKHVGFFLSLYFCSRKSIMQVIFSKNSPVTIALRMIVLARPPTWSTLPLPCLTMQETQMIGTSYLLTNSWVDKKWVEDLYCSFQIFSLYFSNNLLRKWNELIM